MPVFTDVPDWLSWANSELDEAFRQGLAHGAGPSSLFGPRPDGWDDNLWALFQAQKVQTVCMVLRAAQPWRAAAKLRLPSVVRITGEGVGTAFAVGRRNNQFVMLTDAHCVCNEAGVRSAGQAQRVVDLQIGVNAPRPFSIVHVSDKGDFALVTDPFGLPPIPLASSEPQVGTLLCGIGCGAGVPGRVMQFVAGPRNDGTINGVKQALMADSATVQPGDSGGCVLDTSACLTNMVTSYLPGGAMDNVIPWATLKDYLTEQGVDP